MPKRPEAHRTGGVPPLVLGGFVREVRRCLVQSEIEGGLRLGELKNGSRVLVQTLNSRYELQIRDGQTWISGHPEFCPHPVPVSVRGSNWGGSMLKVAYLGRGMQMEFQQPDRSVVTTSSIVSIHMA